MILYWLLQVPIFSAGQKFCCCFIIPLFWFVPYLIPRLAALCDCHVMSALLACLLARYAMLANVVECRMY